MKKLALTLPGDHTINNPSGFNFTNQPVTAILNSLIEPIFVIAGLLLLGYLVLGGFEMLTSGGNPESIAKGQGKITHAIIGFIIIFVSYWLVQLLQHMLGITILG